MQHFGIWNDKVTYCVLLMVLLCGGGGVIVIIFFLTIHEISDLNCF